MKWSFVTNQPRVTERVGKSFLAVDSPRAFVILRRTACRTRGGRSLDDSVRIIYEQLDSRRHAAERLWGGESKGVAESRARSESSNEKGAFRQCPEHLGQEAGMAAVFPRVRQPFLADAGTRLTSSLRQALVPV